MITIKSHSTPYENGFAHGKGAKDPVTRSITFYQKMFLHTCKMNWNTVRDTASAWEETISTKWPRYYSEMKGISDGAQVPLIDIVILNIRTEIAFGMFDDGCTSLYWKTGDASFLAQNWDWMEEQKQNLILLDIKTEDGPRIKMVTEAGIIGKIGMNELGVGVCLNAIKVPGCDTSRLPVHLALRMGLESSSAEQAVSQLQDIGIAASAHILVADSETAIGVESTLKTIKCIPVNQQDRMFHANHLLLAHEGIVDAGWLADSPCRQERIREVAGAFSGEMDMKGILGLLDDHDGFPFSICRFEEGPLGMDATLFSIVMDLRGGKGTLYLGRPCQPEEILLLGFE